MNAILLLNQISPLLSKNKLDELKNFILALPWDTQDNQQATEKLLIGPQINGRWVELEPSIDRRFWFRTIRLLIQDYEIILTSRDTAIQRINRISWKRQDDLLAASKEW